MHEIGLLLANYMIRQHKHQTIYLGQNVPLEDVLQVCEQYKPHFIFTFITAPKNQEDLHFLFTSLHNVDKKAIISVSGNAQHFDFKLPTWVKYLASVNDLETILN